MLKCNTYFLVFLMLSVFLNVFPQSHKELDSLRLVLKNDIHDTVRLKALAAMSELCEEDSIPDYTVPGLKLSEDLYSEHPEYERVIILYRAKLYNNQAYFLQKKGDITNAIDLNMKAMALYEKYGWMEDLSVAVNNIGSLYLSEANYKKALEFFHRSLTIRKQFKNPLMISIAFGNIGSVHYRTMQWDSALYYHREAAKLITIKSAPANVANIYNNIGAVYSKKKQFDSALVYLEKAKDIWVKFDKQRVALCLANIADVYYFKGNIRQSITIGEEAYAIAKQTAIPYNISTCANLLKRSYESVNNYEKALFYYEEHKKFQDSILNDEAKHALTRAQMQYEYDKKAAISEVRRKEKETIANEEQTRLNIIIYSISSGLLVLLIFSVYIFRGYRNNKKSHTEISVQKRVIEEKQKEILDSIHYAKRIQTSLLPTDKYISQKITISQKNR